MQTSLFDLENRYASLSEAGDPLERLNVVVDGNSSVPCWNERIDAKERKTAAVSSIHSGCESDTNDWRYRVAAAASD